MKHPCEKIYAIGKTDKTHQASIRSWILSKKYKLIKYKTMQESKQILSKLMNLMHQNKITMQELSEKSGYSEYHLSGFFQEKFPLSIEVLLTISTALGYDLTFSRKFDYTTTKSESKFLMCPDEANKQLYILHREEPVCLIHVLQTTPISFVVHELYSEMDNTDDILNMPFVQEAKDFFFKHVKINEN
jgi:transcriptional regulator with XRE-family HTH domain